MDAKVIAQIANPILRTIIVHRVRALLHHQELISQVQETVQGRTTRGRPLVNLFEAYEHLTAINLIFQNVSPGPAKNITFTFSPPVESSGGFVLSELTFYPGGMTSLASDARIVCYWDELGNPQPMIQEGHLERNIMVTVEYQDISGSRSHDWESEILRSTKAYRLS